MGEMRKTYDVEFRKKTVDPFTLKRELDIKR